MTGAVWHVFEDLCASLLGAAGVQLLTPPHKQRETGKSVSDRH